MNGNMNDDHEKHLEDWLHGELRELPDRPAPHDLIARVQSAIAERSAQPWWTQAWFAWPQPARLASAVLVFACLVALLWGAHLIWPASTGIDTTGFLSSLEPLMTALSTLGSAFELVLESLNTTYLTFAAVLLGMMYLACIGLGTLFFRVALNRR